MEKLLLVIQSVIQIPTANLLRLVLHQIKNATILVQQAFALLQQNAKLSITQCLVTVLKDLKVIRCSNVLRKGRTIQFNPQLHVLLIHAVLTLNVVNKMESVHVFAMKITLEILIRAVDLNVFLVQIVNLVFLAFVKSVLTPVLVHVPKMPIAKL